MSQRKSRVEHALRDVLTELISAEVKDPRVRSATLITVTRVELNVDMAVADVYISVVPSNDDALTDDVLAGLAKAAGFLRGPAARKLSLQRAPELRFHHDATVDVSAKLAAILREDEAKAQAAGRSTTGSGHEPPPAGYAASAGHAPPGDEEKS